MDGSKRKTQDVIGLDRIVELARKHLELDAAFIAEFTPEGPVCRAVSADRNMLCRHSPGMLPADPAAVPGVHLTLSNGEAYGKFCAMGADVDEGIGGRDTRLLSMLAELVIPELEQQRERDKLRAGIVGLIESEMVDVAYQPVFGLRTGRCLGVEALARFPKPFQRPDRTFAHAERLGLSLELEELVVRRAWPVLELLGPEQFLALNLTPGSLLALARRANRRTDVDLSHLVVEVTEHQAIAAYAALRKELRQLRARGLRIAVDDAGAGYASLRHVLELRPDIVKVDRWLIHGLSEDCARKTTVRSLVSMASELGAMIVAEGVEQAADRDAARELGFDAAQGYLLGRPSTDDRALKCWLTERSRSTEATPPTTTRTRQAHSAAEGKRHSVSA